MKSVNTSYCDFEKPVTKKRRLLSLVAAVAAAGEISGEEICEKTNHQMKYLKRDLLAAVEAGILDPDDSDLRVAVYRYRPPKDSVARQLIELCF